MAQPKEEIEGELEVLVYDYPDRAEHEYHVKTPKGERIKLKMPPGHQLEKHNLQSGKKVKVRGNRKKTPVDQPDELALDGDDDLEVSALIMPLQYAIGPQKTIVFCVAYSNQPAPCTPQAAKEFFLSVVNPFYEAASLGKTRFVGNKNPNDPGDFVATTLTIPSGGCDLQAITTQSRAQAIAMGYPTNMFGAYLRFVYLIPASPCGWSGLATVGGVGGFCIANGQITHRVISHELGHNQGWLHANSELTPNGGQTTYGNMYDVMGANAGPLGIFYRLRSGWLTDENVPIIAVPGDYTIFPATAGNAVVGIRVRQNRATTDHYYFEYRPDIGGIIVTRASDGATGLPWIRWGNDGGTQILGVGDRLNDPTAPVFARVKSLAPDRAVITVNFTPLGSPVEGWTYGSPYNTQCPLPGPAQTALGASAFRWSVSRWVT